MLIDPRLEAAGIVVVEKTSSRESVPEEQFYKK